VTVPVAAYTLNEEIGSRLDELADLLMARGAAPRRITLYRRGARAVRALPRPVDVILRAEGLAGLIRIPSIGEKLARVVRRVAVTGRLPLLERLRAAAVSVETTPASVPSHRTQ
jgi:putative hydrolase